MAFLLFPPIGMNFLMKPHCSSSCRALENVVLSESPVASKMSFLNIPIFLLANAVIMEIWVVGLLNKDA
ncbi:Uncharacterised protein [Segatella copri]|nr:Uncharacterised protein [Segatella copri]